MDSCAEAREFGFELSGGGLDGGFVGHVEDQGAETGAEFLRQAVGIGLLALGALLLRRP